MIELKAIIGRAVISPAGNKLTLEIDISESVKVANLAAKQETVYNVTFDPVEETVIGGKRA